MNDIMNEVVAASGRWERRSPEHAKVTAAFVKAQAAFTHATKDSVNPHFKSKYADLAGVIDTYRNIFAEHGLSVLQPSLTAPTGAVRVQTIILHESGEWLADGGLTISADKQTAQGLGSALTYARRYGMASFLGIAQDDDDGNAASGNAAPTSAAQAHTTPPQQQTQAAGGLVWPFGKEKGQPISAVATKSLEWGLENSFDVTDEKFGQSNQQMRKAIEAELDTRLAGAVQQDDSIPF